ncbi:Cytochrome c-type biogenesis protein CcmH [Paraburkholderia caffeinitolerans]|uniref:Cytochrome c-type biogenesis protein n=1 Tax=Paraburkholderia caffeinitolerans TaxID=1723730 RepID=A0A6J5FJK1_9BURK|nr:MULTISPECIES: cytochrome c-type biogenesis protein [Paraburkholderia]CAB3778989.1 Cytochrome c-type biogenesis protein CcmH [Paraburkholderia caffeinitolerans]
MNRPMRAWAARLGIALMVAHASTIAIAAGEVDADARLRRLDESFRCVVCQNQSLADSNAELAADLRTQIRDQVRSGATDEQIKAYMVRRYGDFVLYRPPLKPVTWALWLGPFIVLAAGAWAMWRSIVHRRGLSAAALDAGERARVASLRGHEEEGAAS